MISIETIGPYFNFLKLQFIPKHNLSYIQWGDPNNTDVVICVHGLTRNAKDFEYLGKELAKDFKVIAIDLPGRGNSSWLANKNHYNYNTYVKDIMLFLKQMKFRSVHFIGTSMGGIIGMALATYYSKYIRSIVINDIGPELPRKTVKRIEKYVNLDISFPTKDIAKDHMKKIFKNFGIREEKDWDHITENSIRLCQDNKYRLSYDPNILEGTSLRKTESESKNSEEFVNLWYLWKNVKCPSLLIHGTESDILLKKTIDKMYFYRNFDLHEIENTGHAPALIYKKDIDIIHNWLISNS